MYKLYSALTRITCTNVLFGSTVDQELYVTLPAGSRRTLRVYSPVCNTFLREMTSWPLIWKYDVIPVNMTPSTAKFHLDPIWNDVRSLRLLLKWSPFAQTRRRTI